jgi:hypothetical protein
MVVINTKDALDHDALWNTPFSDLKSAMDTLAAQLDGLADRADADRTTLRANLGIVRLNERFQRRPRHDRRHLGQKNVALRAFLLARKVQRRKAQLRIHDVALRIEDASMPASRN